MRAFDLHADLGWHIRKMHHAGENRILERYHLDKLKQGEVMYTAAACFFAGRENWEEMLEMIDLTRTEIRSSDVKLILSPEDLDENEERVSMILTVEGMCGIDRDPEEKIKILYDRGVRIGSLAWNDQNALATGNSGDPARGLTELGKRAVRKMNELHMIVDVSHANEKTFWDILDTSDAPVIATHSNAKRLCFVERNLTDQQIRALAEKGGLFGMNSCAEFIHEDAEQQDAAHLAMHAKYMADLCGIEHIACGFDYMDFYDYEIKENDIRSADQTQNFMKALRHTGMSEEDVRKIGYENVFRFLKEQM